MSSLEHPAEQVAKAVLEGTSHAGAIGQLEIGERAAIVIAAEERAGATTEEGARWAVRQLGEGALVSVAEFYARTGDRRRAEQCYRACALSGLWFHIALLGCFFWREKRLEEARVCFRRAVDLPQSPDAIVWVALALLSDALGRENDAKGYAKEAASRSQNHSAARRLMVAFLSPSHWPPGEQPKVE